MMSATPPGGTPAKTDGPLAPERVADQLVLALHAEALAVTKRQVVRTVTVQRKTRSRDSLVQEALATTSVVVEHVPMGHFVDGVPPVRQEGDVTILPVVEEVVVIERRLRLVEEVHIRRVQSSTTHVETVTLREQHVVVTRSEPEIQEGPAAAPIPADQQRTIQETPI